MDNQEPFIIAHFMGLGLAFAIPHLVKCRHVRRQNALLHRARAHLVMAEEYLDAGEWNGARAKLAQIERLEALWRYGSSRLYLCALGISAILAGIVGGAGTRALGVFAAHVGPLELSQPVITFIVIESIVPIFAAITAWREEWKPAELLDNCSERLKAWLNAGRGIVVNAAAMDDPGEGANRRHARRGIVVFVAPKRDPGACASDPLSPLELLGLKRIFTRRELDAARRRVAMQVHPDLGPPAERKNRERSMRRVNAAYDELLPLAAA